MWKVLIAVGFLQVITSTFANVSEVGFYCTTNKECEYYEAENVYSECVSGYCHCYNKKPKSDTKCIPKTLHTNNIIGGHCPCSLPHAECNTLDNLCYCETDYIPTEDKRRCIPEKVSMGDPCEMHRQCLALNVFGHCANDTKRCTCADGFYERNFTCLPQTTLKLKCDDEMKCTHHGPNMICLPSTHECACEPGYVSSNDTEKCIPQRRYEESCRDTLQCQAIMGPGASCDQGKCRCAKEYALIQKNTEDFGCKPLVAIGQYCKADEHCHNGLTQKNEEQLMECYLGECVCRFGIKNKTPCSTSKGADVKTSKMAFFLLFFVIVLI